MKTMISLALLGVLSGCASNNLLYAHNAVLGIDVSVSPESTTRLTVGYDRETFAIVPRKGEHKDAMSLVAVSCVYGRAMDEVRFNHMVATGSPAKRIAREALNDNGAQLGEIRNAIYGGTNKCD
jgi:hypothetical protein